jgi:hypothetical protein
MAAKTIIGNNIILLEASWMAVIWPAVRQKQDYFERLGMQAR